MDSALQEARSALPFQWPVRIYYEDTDSGGVVYYANYLKYLERARTEWLRVLGFEQNELLAEHCVIFVVRELKIEYLRPALFNDLLTVSVVPALQGGSQIEVEQKVWRGADESGNDLLVQAQVKLVCVNHQTFKPVRIPSIIKQRVMGE